MALTNVKSKSKIIRKPILSDKYLSINEPLKEFISNISISELDEVSKEDLARLLISIEERNGRPVNDEELAHIVLAIWANGVPKCDNRIVDHALMEVVIAAKLDGRLDCFTVDEINQFLLNVEKRTGQPLSGEELTHILNVLSTKCQRKNIEDEFRFNDSELASEDNLQISQGDRDNSIAEKFRICSSPCCALISAENSFNINLKCANSSIEFSFELSSISSSCDQISALSDVKTKVAVEEKVLRQVVYDAKPLDIRLISVFNAISDLHKRIQEIKFEIDEELSHIFYVTSTWQIKWKNTVLKTKSIQKEEITDFLDKNAQINIDDNKKIFVAPMDEKVAISTTVATETKSMPKLKEICELADDQPFNRQGNLEDEIMLNSKRNSVVEIDSAAVENALKFFNYGVKFTARYGSIPEEDVAAFLISIENRKGEPITDDELEYVLTAIIIKIESSFSSEPAKRIETKNEQDRSKVKAGQSTKKKHKLVSIKPQKASNPNEYEFQDINLTPLRNCANARRSTLDAELLNLEDIPLKFKYVQEDILPFRRTKPLPKRIIRHELKAKLDDLTSKNDVQHFRTNLDNSIDSLIDIVDVMSHR